MRKRTCPPFGSGILCRTGRRSTHLLILALLSLPAAGQIATWEFDGPSLNVTYTEAGLQGAAATAGNGVTAPGVTTACKGYAWQGAGLEKPNRMSALGTNDYVEFRLTAAVGYQATIRTIFFYANSSNISPKGPNQVSIRINDTWVEMGGTSTFTLTQGSTCPGYGIIADAPVTIPPNTTATIRLYAWNGDHDGLLRIDDVFVFGSVGLLPIELTAFTGKTTDEAIHLTWTTASELNNDYMAVERSADGRAFGEVGRVAGRGATYQTQTYSFIDFSPGPGVNYYRLRQVDFDGTTTYHPVISVIFKGNTTAGRSLRVYPNPVGEELHILWNALPLEEALLRIFDSSGRIVARHILTPPFGETIPVAQLAAGAYFLQLIQTGQVKTGRFVKE